jgi:hypothetical protein
MTAEPHPQRCETCTIPKNVTLPKWCPIAKVWLSENAVVWRASEVVGCASHSSAKSERDKVLDKFKEIIQLRDEDDLLYEFLVIYKSLREQP